MILSLLLLITTIYLVEVGKDDFKDDQKRKSLTTQRLVQISRTYRHQETKINGSETVIIGPLS